jgi:hypothetical protein
MPFGLRWASGVPRAPAFRSCRDKTGTASHELARSYRVPRARDGRAALPRPRRSPKWRARLPPLRFSPLQRLPARGSSMMAGFASPDRLRPQVFSTSRRVHPPRACRPCFMPDPLMGLCPSELCSFRVAVRRLRRRSPLAVGWTRSRRPPSFPVAPKRCGSTRNAPTSRSNHRNETTETPARTLRWDRRNDPAENARHVPEHRAEARRSNTRHLRPRERPRLQGFAPHGSPPLARRLFRPPYGA